MVPNNIIHKYLDHNLGKFRSTRQGLKYNCPKPGCDQGDKFNLEIDTVSKNVFNCWACRYSGFINELFNDYAIDNSWRQLDCFKYTKRTDEIEEIIIDFPKETVPFYLKKEVLEYLTIERGISKAELIRRKVQYVYSKTDKHYNNIYFPFYDEGKLIGACLHNLETKAYKNLGKLTYVPYKEFINPNYPVMITEGVYDALSGCNAIPILRTEINKSTLEFLHNKHTILSLDNTIDKGLYAKQIEMIMFHNPKSLDLFDLHNYKDNNSFYLNDKILFFDELIKTYKSLLNEAK